MLVRSVDEIALLVFKHELQIDMASEDGVVGVIWPIRGDTPSLSLGRAFSFDLRDCDEVGFSLFRNDSPDDARVLLFRRPAPTGTSRSVPPSVQYRWHAYTHVE